MTQVTRGNSVHLHDGNDCENGNSKQYLYLFEDSDAPQEDIPWREVLTLGIFGACGCQFSVARTQTKRYKKQD